MRPASSALPGIPSDRYGRRGSSKAVSGSADGSGTSPARVSPIAAGRCAWAIAPISGRAAWTARWMARSDVGPRPLRDTASRLGSVSRTTTRSSGVSSSLRIPGGVTSRRSASSRIDRLPSPAEMRPLAPSRRPARISRSVASAMGSTPESYALPRTAVPSRWRRAPTDHRPQYHPTMPSEPAAQPLAEPIDVPLAQNRDFRVLLTSQGISSLGDGVSFAALPLLVLALTGSGFAMGIVGALQTLPDLFLGLVAGAIADRSDRKRMMFLADLGRAGLTALIPISVALDGPTMAVILLVAAPTSILRSFFLAGYTASVPALVGRSQVGKANSYFEAIYSAGYIIGPAIAGVLAATIGPGPTLAIDALSFGLSALGLLFVRRDLRAPVDRPRRRLLTEIREGIDFIAADLTLRTVILFWGATSILLAPLVTALAVHVTRDLGQPASVLGLILASYGVGTVLGSLLTARRIGRGRVTEILLGGNLVIGLALLGVAVSVTIPLQIAAAFVGGVAQSMVLVTYITLRTAYSPDDLLGRIGSTARSISLGLQPIGLLVGGALIDLTSGSATIALIGIAVAAIAFVFAPIAAMRHATVMPR